MRVSESQVSPRRWLLWGLGNLLVVAGLFALIYVGGLYIYQNGPALERPQVPATPQVLLAPALALTPTPSPPLPLLNHNPAEPPPPAPTLDPAWRSRLTRITIPTLDLDSPVVAVAWHVEEWGGQQVAVWDVAKYAVGHHHGSGNPGEGTNIVLAGHSGGFGAVFRRLIELQPGDEVTLYTEDRQYLYVVEEALLLQEVNVPMEERLRNARYMAPTEEERVTLITCWPVPIYDKRVIVLARPYRTEPFPRPDLIAD